MDNFEVYTNQTGAGVYYIKTDNYFPMRGNGYYYFNMVDYCLKNKIITNDNIKFVLKANLTLPANYYNKWINYVTSVTHKPKNVINAMIGSFNYNQDKHENWRSVCITQSSNEAYAQFLMNDAHFIDVMNIDGVRYFHVFKKFLSSKIEIKSHIYNQIVQQEYIDLYELSQLIKSKGGMITDLNTDAITCTFPDDVLPFELLDDGKNIKGYNYPDNTPKYKIEAPHRVKIEKMKNRFINAPMPVIDTPVYKIFNDVGYVAPVLTKNVKLINIESFREVDEVAESLENLRLDNVKLLREIDRMNCLIDKVSMEDNQDVNKPDLISKLNIGLSKSKSKLIKNNSEIESLKAQPRVLTKYPVNKIIKQETFMSPVLTEVSKTNQDINDFKPLVKTMLDLQQSFTIQGPAGVGKSYFVKTIQDELTTRKLKFVSLAPTNKASLIINGTTLNKFRNVMKTACKADMLNLDYIIVDEVSMMKEEFYQFLRTIKHYKKFIKFILVGDFNQLEPVNDRVVCNYSNSSILNELSDGNKLMLTTCRRADDKLFNLLQFDNIPNIKISQFSSSSSDVNICFTNDMRIQINDKLMKQHKSVNSIELKSLHKKIDPNSQNVILSVGMPVIGKKNDAKQNVVNNKTYKIVELNIANECLTIMDSENEEIKKHNDMLHQVAKDYATKTKKKFVAPIYEPISCVRIPICLFQYLFYPAYCITTHKAQGQTIKEPFTIHEFDRMDHKLKYVALTRATKLEDINIIKSSKRLSPVFLEKIEKYNL